MFFIGGITQGTKELVYNAAAMICGRCGRYGRYQVFMTYMCLSFFFIPIFKWGRKYYVKTSLRLDPVDPIFNTPHYLIHSDNNDHLSGSMDQTGHTVSRTVNIDQFAFYGDRIRSHKETVRTACAARLLSHGDPDMTDGSRL